jgi:transcriptional regulator with XRE-family HTH domain
MRKTTIQDAKKWEVRRREFGGWLAEHRNRLGLSQAEAGQRAGMSRTQWTRLELGLSGTRRDNIPKIAEALNTDLVETYKRAGFDPPRDLLDDVGFDESDFVFLFHKHQKLSKEGKEDFKRILQMVKNELDRFVDQEGNRK